MKKSFFLLVSLFCAFTLTAQKQDDITKIKAGTNTKELARLAPIYDSIFKAEKAEAFKIAKIKGWKTIFNSDKNGGITELIRLDKFGNPVYFTTDNAGAAITTRANRLNTGGSLGLQLDGQNMNIGVWDGGRVRSTHVLLAGRVTQVDNPPSLSAHATHVSGTMMGNGTTNLVAKGMASLANLRAYDWNSDVSEVSNAAANGLLISNHSYGSDPDFVSLIDWGKYDNDARVFDNIMFNAPYYLFVNSAGNSRNNGYNEEKQGYDLLSGKSTSKNGMIVAAVTQVTNYVSPASVVMSGFSSWGPTDDGRIKPDICGKGVNVRSSVSSSNTAYSNFSGTSMSSPNVAGTLLLLQQHYNNVKGNYMKSATLRGLAIHTADEAGTSDGPDYRFGWGLLNAEKAAVLINNDKTLSYIQEDTLNQGNSYSFTIAPSDFSKPIVASICWTDPAGQVLESIIDLDTPRLVNDLDIRITKENEINYPWKLNPHIPDDDAIRGDNIVDNIEKIEVVNPTGKYNVTVSHKGNLKDDTQNFSLIISNVAATSMLLTTSSNLINRTCQGQIETVFNFDLRVPATFAETATFTVEGLPSGASASFSEQNLTAAGNANLVVNGLNNVPAGTYPLLIKVNSATYSSELLVTLVVQNSLSNGPVLNSPANNTNPVSTTPTLVWENFGNNAANYSIELAKDNSFTTNVQNFTSALNQIDLTNLDFGSNYFWRVKANNVCGTSDYSPIFQFTTSCSSDAQITLSNITSESATITWTNPNGSSQFEVLIVPQGTPPTGPFQPVSTNSFTFTGLNSYSDYDVYVRAICSNNIFSNFVNVQFETLINHCVDGIFFDSGGPTGNYSNGEYKFTTMSPLNDGDYVTVTFNAFQLEDQIDRLYIYNGPNATFPYIGPDQYGFTGNNSPGVVTSTDPSGKLTFAFYSDGANTNSGWNASVTCAALSTTTFSRNNLQYFPNPTKTVLNFICQETIKSITIYNLLGQVIRTQDPNSHQTVINIADLESGQYLFKVETNSTVNTVKILKN